MIKKTLAIVSSYDELCGNASYTKALEKELSNHFDVTVVALDVQLLRKNDPNRVTTHIQNLCKQLETFDCVNIQLEAGLFGPTPAVIKKNFFQILKVCKNPVITMHRYQSYERYPNFIDFGKRLLQNSIRSVILSYKKVFANNRYVPFYHAVIRYCQKKQIPIVFHTKREKKSIQLDFGYNNIFDHPLCFYDQTEIRAIKEQHTKTDFLKDLGLSENKTYIGIFGFINQYKGHETAIRALNYLPKNFELLICGSQHPHTIQMEEPINDYIDKLLKLIVSLKLSKRVKFHRFAKDEDFLKVLIHCDYNVLPYLEVMQGGSAIAALSLETNSKALFSQNHAFFELEKYAKDSFPMFTIGNYMELATAILSYNSSKYSIGLNRYHEKYNIHASGILYRNLLNRTYSVEQLQAEDSELAYKII